MNGIIHSRMILIKSMKLLINLSIPLLWIINNESNKLINEIKCQIKKDKNKKKDNDKGNSISKVICSLKEDLPEDEQTKIDNMLQELYDIHEAS